MGLQQNILTEPVSRLTLRTIIKVSSDSSVSEALKIMQEQKLGCAVIIDSYGIPIGTFTESMLVKILAHHPEKLNDRIDSHLDPKWAKVKISDPVRNVLEAMEQKNIRFVVVTDDAGIATALSGQKGLMQYIANHFPRRVLVQKVGADPYIHEREGA